jgi:hypothetical protein
MPAADQLDPPEQMPVALGETRQPDGLLDIVAEARVMGLQDIEEKPLALARPTHNDKVGKHRPNRPAMRVGDFERPGLAILIAQPTHDLGIGKLLRQNPGLPSA